ncbi:hypothetical protein ACWCQN_11015 [Streptomyces sp. NPDC001984]
MEVQPAAKAVRDVPKPRRSKTSKGKALLPMPTMKQLLTVSCPSCGRSAGSPCTLRQGHRARVELYRLKNGITRVDGAASTRLGKAAGPGRRSPQAKSEERPAAGDRDASAATAPQPKQAPKKKRPGRGLGVPVRVNPNPITAKEILAVRCPVCRADRGVPCEARDGAGLTVFHTERRQVARAVTRRPGASTARRAPGGR